MQKHGDLFGSIPYDFRRPNWARLKKRMWNPDDERMITPRDFGIGWTVNLYQLRRRYPALFYILVAVTAIWFALGVRRYFTESDEE